MGNVPDINFLSENRISFTIFMIFGLIPSRYGFDNKKWRPCLTLFFSRLCWFLWHVLGATLGIWNWYAFTYHQQESSHPSVLHYHYDVAITIFNTTQKSECSDVEINPSINHMPAAAAATPVEEQHQYSDLFLSMSGIILVLMIIGPLQSNVIKRNMDFFPRILKNIRKLEAIQLPKKINNSCSEEEEEMYLLDNVDFDLTDGKYDEEDNRNAGRKRNCCTNCYDKNLLPKISVGIFVTIFSVCFCVAAYDMHDLEDLMNEWKLILMVFFLPLPVLTTWFCTVLINEIRKLYDELYDLKREAFTDSTEMMKITDYITILQRTVELMKNEIFEFTIGMNFTLFVTIGTISTYEIYQGFQETKRGNKEDQFTYAEVDYMIPLLISTLSMYKICSASHDLMTDVYERLLLRMKEILSRQLYVKHVVEGNYAKKIKHLYGNLKDWPPQINIYGGWKVNFELFVGIVIFMFIYAKLFYDM